MLLTVPTSFNSANCTVTFAIPLSPDAVSYFPSPCLVSPVLNSPVVASSNTVPSTFLSCAYCNLTGGAWSVSSSYVSTLPGLAFPGTESISTAATIFVVPLSKLV